MVTTTGTELQDAPPGELVLRVSNTSLRGQVVRLRGEKCSIGSGLQCTLRLNLARVRPVHCLIVRGRQATVVRCWAPGTRLNGRQFSDAVLAAGDRLSVGPVEFEVLDTAIPPEPADDPADRRHFEALRQRLADSARHGRRRARGLIGQLRSVRARLTEMEALGEQMILEHQHEQQELLAEQQGERETADQARQRWEAELEEKHETLNQQRLEWEAERSEAEARLAARSEELDVEAGTLNQRNWDLDQQDQELQRRTEELDSLCAEWEAREERFRDLDAEAPALEAPPATAVREDGSAPPNDEKKEDDSADEPGAGSRRATDREESIDEYMARLLERAGTAGEEQEGWVSQPSKHGVSGSEKAAAEAIVGAPNNNGAEEPGTPQSAAIQECESSGITPRAAAAEETADLSALRELANYSARQALDHYARRMLSRSMRANLAVTAVSLAAGAVLAWFWWTGRAGQVSLSGAVTALMIALFWGVREAVSATRKTTRDSTSRDAEGTEAD